MIDELKQIIKNNHFNYENFETNLETLMERFPSIGFMALSFSSDYTFFKNDNQELNLLKDGKLFYESDSLSEHIEKLSSSCDLNNKEILYIYGLGLGYSYLAFKDFLKADIKNEIVFIEDDEEIFFNFLHTDLADKILVDPQVHIAFFSKKEKKQTQIELLTKKFPTKKIAFTTDILSNKSPRTAQDLKLKLQRTSFLEEALFTDRLYSHFPFQNFVQNVKKLTQSFFGNKLKGVFENIPALVVGAGPSLENDFEEIKKLENKALIFAGGSSLAALSSNGILPHIGLALDPNYEEFQRMQANVAQEIPFFYSTRVHPLVFSAFNGMLGYLRSGIGGVCELMIEEELNLNGELIGEKLDHESLSVTTIAIALAEYLGCGPIILVGCDLSFSSGKRYVKGVENTISSLNRFELIKRKDINKKTVYTTTHWIMESSCISNFAKASKKVFYNATSSGIGFKGIENVSLKKLSDSILQDEYDLRNRLFFEIQRNEGEIQGKIFIEAQLNKLKESIARCKGHVEVMIEELDKIDSDEKIKESGRLILSEMDLREEDAFNYLFYDIDNCLNKLFERRYKNKSSQKKIKKEKLQLFLEKIDFHFQVMNSSSQPKISF